MNPESAKGGRSCDAFLALSLLGNFLISRGKTGRPVVAGGWRGLALNYRVAYRTFEGLPSGYFAVVNAYYTDRNGDNYLDRFMADDDQNGVIEVYLDDNDYDGFLEHGAVDTTQNRRTDQFAWRAPQNPDQ